MSLQFILYFETHWSSLELEENISYTFCKIRFVFEKISLKIFFFTIFAKKKSFEKIQKYFLVLTRVQIVEYLAACPVIRFMDEVSQPS